jgi:hypothetical protein
MKAASWNVRTILERIALAILAAGVALACDGGGLPYEIDTPQTGAGPRVRWDLDARPLPEIPLPNDVATWPDPSSPTGRRINASFIAPTRLESRVRTEFGELDGWGTYAPISVAFDAPLDLRNLVDRQGGTRFSATDFARHAVYLVDLETGVPVPIDVDSGSFHYVTENTNRYFPNDPRGLEAQTLLESVEEDTNLDGVLDPGEDTDFDGVLDHPNTLDGRRGASPEDTYDDTVFFWERETNTLLLRPILPLREAHEYAVVLTDRLVGLDGSPVRSPFDAIHHVSQFESISRLRGLFASHPEVYGDLATRGFDGVRFAWSFTTQTVMHDLIALRDGLYGRGPYAFLADQFPPDLYPAPSRGGTPTHTCDPGSPNVTVVPWAVLHDTIRTLATTALGVDGAGADALLATYDDVDHVVIGYFQTPFLAGDPRAPGPDDHWALGSLDAAHPPHTDLVPVLIVVPREDATHHQPFPVTFYGHGYTGSDVEAFGFAGEVARNGVATVAIDAVGHGNGFDPNTRRLAEALFASSCLGPMGRLLSVDRAVDLNHDGIADPGGDFWSAYLFHTRDVVRQTVLDHIQLIRILRQFSGAPGGPRTTPSFTWTPPPDPRNPHATDPITSSSDLTGAGHPTPAGDFDGNGTPDIGGWDNGYHAWGESLGAFIASLLGAVDPTIRTAAPTSGAGGLQDVGIRTDLGGVRNAVSLRAMGPLVLGIPRTTGPNADSACAMGETSIQFLVTDVNDARAIEFACLSSSELAEGDAVVVSNLTTREIRCGGVGTSGTFRVPIPADAPTRVPGPTGMPDGWTGGNVLSVDVYQGAATLVDYATCTMRDHSHPRPSRSIATWESGNGGGADHCMHCATYQAAPFEDGSFLVAPAEGFGLRRQTPEFRRFQALAQIALEPADPINYVRSYFLEPIHAPDATYTGPRSLLVAMSIGDQDVPISAGNAMARAAGLLPFVPSDGPDALADWRTPPAFMGAHGYASPHDLLNAYHVLEGVSRLDREPIMGALDFLADVDNLGDGLQLYQPNGDPGGTLRPVTAVPPLRWTRATMAATATTSPFDPPYGTYAAISGVLEIYVVPQGNHGTEVPDPHKTWDEGVYYPHLLGRWFATDGHDLRYHTDPVGHLCLENWTCDFSHP